MCLIFSMNSTFEHPMYIIFKLVGGETTYLGELQICLKKKKTFACEI